MCSSGQVTHWKLILTILANNFLFQPTTTYPTTLTGHDIIIIRPTGCPKKIWFKPIYEFRTLGWMLVHWSRFLNQSIICTVSHSDWVTCSQLNPGKFSLDSTNNYTNLFSCQYRKLTINKRYLYSYLVQYNSILLEVCTDKTTHF